MSASTAAAEQGARARHRLTFTVIEAAEALGIGRGLAYEMVRQGHLPSLRLGRRIVVPAASLEALLEQAATSSKRLPPIAPGTRSL
ncbi:helix-turn-helix domain-containing protein [Pedococcus sp. 5OH_020]|uniref:helix-turn-helix domain-containing protein n=1 Tax=Pedococcus sp. 5OH_020 TaxID=2989814 RepID=UPI0022E9D5E5|nr:helix-turn-helix domain-containing protein [Pedococcus sp. 5OH_020]